MLTFVFKIDYPNSVATAVSANADTACHSLVFVNCASVTPFPIAAVDEIPPVTVFIKLST